MIYNQVMDKLDFLIGLYQFNFLFLLKLYMIKI